MFQRAPPHPSEAERLLHLLAGQGGGLGDDLWALALAEEPEGAQIVALGLVHLGEGARVEVESKT